jgi:hypothetical protein
MTAIDLTLPKDWIQGFVEVPTLPTMPSLELKPKLKFPPCPTPMYIWNESETIVFNTRCMGWPCQSCADLKSLREFIKLHNKIDMRGTDGLKVIAFDLKSPIDDKGYWIEIGEKFSYARRQINSKRHCSHCKRAVFKLNDKTGKEEVVSGIRYPDDYKGEKRKKDLLCYGPTESGICKYKIDEYYAVREIQMLRLLKYNEAVRHLHVLFWADFIPLRLIKHYWPKELGSFKIQSLERDDPKKAAGYMIKYLNKHEATTLFHKGERRLSKSRGFFDGQDDKGNIIPQVIEEWKNLLVPPWDVKEKWNVATFWKAPIHIVMLLLSHESIRDNRQTQLDYFA